MPDQDIRFRIIFDLIKNGNVNQTLSDIQKVQRAVQDLNTQTQKTIQSLQQLGQQAQNAGQRASQAAQQAASGARQAAQATQQAATAATQAQRATRATGGGGHAGGGGGGMGRFTQGSGAGLHQQQAQHGGTLRTLGEAGYRFGMGAAWSRLPGGEFLVNAGNILQGAQFITEGFQMLLTRLPAAGVAIGVATVALAGMGAAMYSSVRAADELIDRVIRLSDVTGRMTGETARAVNQLTALMGPEGATGAIQAIAQAQTSTPLIGMFQQLTTARRAGAQQPGTFYQPAFTDPFARFGFSLYQPGSTPHRPLPKRQEDVLFEVAADLASTQDAARRQLILNQLGPLLGGVENLGMLERQIHRGREEGLSDTQIRSRMQQQGAFGFTPNENDVRNLDEYKIAQNELAMSFGALKAEIGSGLLPLFTEFIRGIGDGINLVRQFISGMRDFFGVIGLNNEDLQLLARTLGRVFVAALIAVGVVLSPLILMFISLAKALADLIRLTTDLWMAFNNFVMAVSAGVKPLSDLHNTMEMTRYEAAATGTPLKRLVDNLMAFTAAYKAADWPAFGALIKTALDQARAAIERFLEALENLKEALAGPWTPIIILIKFMLDKLPKLPDFEDIIIKIRFDIDLPPFPSAAEIWNWMRPSLMGAFAIAWAWAIERLRQSIQDMIRGLNLLVNIAPKMLWEQVTAPFINVIPKMLWELVNSPIIDVIPNMQWALVVPPTIAVVPNLLWNLVKPQIIDLKPNLDIPSLVTQIQTAVEQGFEAATGAIGEKIKSTVEGAVKGALEGAMATMPGVGPANLGIDAGKALADALGPIGIPELDPSVGLPAAGGAVGLAGLLKLLQGGAQQAAAGASAGASFIGGILGPYVDWFNKLMHPEVPTQVASNSFAGTVGFGIGIDIPSLFGGFAGGSGAGSNVQQKGAAWIASQWSGMIQRAAEVTGVDPNLIWAVMQAESTGDPNAVSRAGAMGLMQLMPGTAQGLGVTDPFDPMQSIMGGAQYLRQQLDRFGGNVDLALAAYNSGAGNVELYGGIPPFAETQAYVQKVNEYLNQTGGAATETGATFQQTFGQGGRIPQAFDFTQVVAGALNVQMGSQLMDIGNNVQALGALTVREMGQQGRMPDSFALAGTILGQVASGMGQNMVATGTMMSTLASDTANVFGQGGRLPTAFGQSQTAMGSLAGYAEQDFSMGMTDARAATLLLLTASTETGDYQGGTLQPTLEGTKTKLQTLTTIGLLYAAEATHSLNAGSSAYNALLPQLVANMRPYVGQLTAAADQAASLKGSLDAIPRYIETTHVITTVHRSAGDSTPRIEDEVLPPGIGAMGAIVTRPVTALIGEAGPEALIPLNRLPGAIPLPDDIGRMFGMTGDETIGSGRGNTTVMNFTFNIDGFDFSDTGNIERVTRIVSDKIVRNMRVMTGHGRVV